MSCGTGLDQDVRLSHQRRSVAWVVPNNGEDLILPHILSTLIIGCWFFVFWLCVLVAPFSLPAPYAPFGCSLLLARLHPLTLTLTLTT